MQKQCLIRPVIRRDRAFPGSCTLAHRQLWPV